MSDLVSLGEQRPCIEYFTRSSVPPIAPWPEQTPFVGVECHSEVATAGEDFRAPRRVDEAPSRLLHVLERTIERQLGSAKRVAVMTGGGLDSGALLALVQQWARRHGRSCFAAALDYGGHGDDRPFLRLLQDHLSCEVVRVPPEAGVATFTRACEGLDAAPLLWGTASMEIALFEKAKAEGADCMITGAGGDHLFDGEPRALSAYLRAGRPIQGYRAAHGLRGFPKPRWPFFDWVVRPTLGRLAPRSVRARFGQVPPVHTTPWVGPRLREMLEHERRQRRADLRSWLIEGRASGAARASQLYARHRQQFLAGTGLARIDPFMDESLQRYVDSLPSQWLLRGGVRRGLFREAMGDLIPAALRDRADKAHITYGVLRFVRALGGFEAMRHLARPRFLESLGIVDAARFEGEFELLAAEPINRYRWSRVWPVLVLEAFGRSRFGDRA